MLVMCTTNGVYILLWLCERLGALTMHSQGIAMPHKWTQIYLMMIERTTCGMVFINTHLKALYLLGKGNNPHHLQCIGDTVALKNWTMKCHQTKRGILMTNCHFTMEHATPNMHQQWEELIHSQFTLAILWCEWTNT